MVTHCCGLLACVDRRPRWPTGTALSLFSPPRSRLLIWVIDASQRIELTDGALKAVFVVLRAIKGTRIGEEITEALAGYGLPILATRIYQRVIYPSSAAAYTLSLVCAARSKSKFTRTVSGVYAIPLRGQEPF